MTDLLFKELEINQLIDRATSCLPPKCSNIEDELYFNDEKLANFLPVLIRCYDRVDIHEHTVEKMVCVGAIKGGKVVGTLDVKLENLELLDFQREISNELYVNTLIKIANRLIDNVLRMQLSSVSKETKYVASRLGFFEIDGKHGYIAGDRCIGMGGYDISIAPQLKEYHLLSEDDERLYMSEEIGNYVKCILDWNKRVTPFLIAADVLGILKSVFSEAGVPIKFAIYAMGEQSTGKTTTVTHCCSLYNRKKDVEYFLHNLTATEAKLHQILNVEGDMPTIIDDLRLSDSSSTMRQEQQRLDNLIRVAANNVGKESMSYQYDVNGLAIFLGEYPLKNVATNNRILLLQFFKEDLDKEKLNFIRKNAIDMSYFFAKFIRWAVENYKDIECKIRNQSDRYLNQEASKEAYQERLRAHGNTLIMGFNLFLDFCKSEGWEMNYSAEKFELATANLIENQIECLELDGKEKEDYIFLLYLEVRRILDENELCTKNPERTNWQQPLYYDRKKEQICIPTPTLQDMLENAGMKVTTFTVMNDFETANLLLINQNSKVRVRTKKIVRRRCYVIRYDQWTEYAHNLVDREKNYEA